MKFINAYRIIALISAGVAALIILPALLAPENPALQALARTAFQKICHQDAARSFFLNGVPLPVCARCLGGYLGFAGAWAAMLVIFMKKRANSIKTTYLFGGLAPLAADGLLNALGLIHTPAPARFITGLLFGLTAARALWPVIGQAIEHFLETPDESGADAGVAIGKQGLETE